MQFLIYSTDPNPENAPPPTPELMAEMAKLTEDGIKSGVLIATGALNAKGTRVRKAGDKFTVTDGPFIELKELMGGWALLETKSREEAVEWTKRFLNIVGDGESEIVQVFGPDSGPPG
jgi:hypothetical protein